MPYRTQPEDLRPSITARALAEMWRSDTRCGTDPGGEELAAWWIERCPDPWDGAGPEPAGQVRKAWRRLARHVHLWAYIHEPQRIDCVGMELGIENDWIPEPELTFDSQRRLQNVGWRAPLHLDAQPPLEFLSWQLPLKCLGYVRPAWRTLPQVAGEAPVRGSWWC